MKVFVPISVLLVSMSAIPQVSADNNRPEGLPGKNSSPKISIWYGDQQTFGQLGHAQPLINVLGTIKHKEQVADMRYRVNRGPSKQLILGPDLHRLARPGDFNIEIERNALKPGENIVQIHARTLRGADLDTTVTINFKPDKEWSLPFEVDFTKLQSLQDAVEVIDGKWTLTKQGVRTEIPYYDRQLAFGDTTWKDYDLQAEIIFHHHFVDFQGRNRSGPPYLSHAHTSFNLRWGGHPDDGWVPRRNWQNLGSLVALRCDLAQPKAGSYWWMHFGRSRPGERVKRSTASPETRFKIDLESRYRYRMQVETIAPHKARYRTKVWQTGDEEPADWQMEATDESEALPSGGAVLVVHHSDVTLCSLKVDRLEKPDTK